MSNNLLSNIKHVDFTSGFNPSITSIGDIKNTPGIDQLKPLGKAPKKALSPDLIKGIQGGLTMLSPLLSMVGGGKTTDRGVGDILSSVGNIAGQVVPGWAGAGISAGLNLLGGGYNALFGYKKNDEEIEKLDSKLDALNGLRFNASNTNDFISQNNFSLIDSVNNELGEDGVFSHKIKDLESDYNDKIGLANKQVLSNFSLAAKNLDTMNDRNMLANYTAYGGPLTMKYTGLMSPFGNRFDLGGNMPHSNGGVFSNGLTKINEGGSHESNPYGGVQVGVDPQGIPNLVEEGEVIWDDYVFSNRLKVPKTFKDKYNFKKKDPLSFAEAAEKLAEESKERPDDPISKRGKDAMLSALKDQQEQVRLKMQQRQAKNQFNKLSPEEQLGIMQMAQQQGAMVGPEGDVNNMYQGVPLMAAFGGNLFKEGGPKEKKSRPKTGKYTYDWFLERAKTLGIDLQTFENNFVYDDQNKTNNLNLFNDIYAQYQRQTALDTYIKGRRKDWENAELESGRFKKGDDGNSIYKAKYYTKDDVGKDYISTDGNRITTAEYKNVKDAYEKAKAIDSKKRKEEDNKTIKDFENADYKHSPVVQNQFVRDYNGNIQYDYDTDVSKSWIPNDDTFSKDFKWDPKDVARVSYDPEQHNSVLSYLRYAPALAGVVGLVRDTFIKPDYTRAEEIKKAGAYPAPLVVSNPIGNYLRYDPMDINYGLNKLGAESSAVKRSIMNASQGNVGSAMSGLLAAGYNSQIATGDFYRKALEYNDNLLHKVKTFNNNIDMFNSQQGLEAQKANQNALLNSYKDSYNSILAGNALMDQIDARRNNSMNANLTNLFNSLGQIGEEAYDYDRINYLIERDVLKDLYGK